MCLLCTCLYPLCYVVWLLFVFDCVLWLFVSVVIAVRLCWFCVSVGVLGVGIRARSAFMMYNREAGLWFLDLSRQNRLDDVMFINFCGDAWYPSLTLAVVVSTHCEYCEWSSLLSFFKSDSLDKNRFIEPTFCGKTGRGVCCCCWLVGYVSTRRNWFVNWLSGCRPRQPYWDLSRGTHAKIVARRSPVALFEIGTSGGGIWAGVWKAPLAKDGRRLEPFFCLSFGCLLLVS